MAGMRRQREWNYLRIVAILYKILGEMGSMAIEQQQPMASNLPFRTKMVEVLDSVIGYIIVRIARIRNSH